MLKASEKYETTKNQNIKIAGHFFNLFHNTDYVSKNPLQSFFGKAFEKTTKTFSDKTNFGLPFSHIIVYNKMDI
mgnify:CR=1 FL=1